LAVSSDAGNEKEFINKPLVGGTAILTLGLWASKVTHSSQDDSGFRSFSIATIQGRFNKCLSLVSAYISVQKGSDVGVDSLYAQQVTIHEKRYLPTKNIPAFCPRTNAIKRLNSTIHNLQKKDHAVILMLGANQSFDECFNSSALKPFSIKLLRIQRGMTDPFKSIMSKRPNSSTLLPNRDIDYVLSFGVTISAISTLSPSIPAHSDHLGIIFDIDVESFFSSSYSDTSHATVGLHRYSAGHMYK
jgi:hypothetical protein